MTKRFHFFSKNIFRLYLRRGNRNKCLFCYRVYCIEREEQKFFIKDFFKQLYQNIKFIDIVAPLIAFYNFKKIKINSKKSVCEEGGGSIWPAYNA